MHPVRAALLLAIAAAPAAAVTIACGDAGGGSGAPSAGGGSGPGGAGAGGAGAAGSGAGGAGGGGGGTGGGGAGGGSGLTGEAFVEGFARALCGHYRACGGELYGGALMKAFGDEGRCASELARALLEDVRLGALRAGAASGALRVEPAAMQACLDAARQCSQPFESLPGGALTYDDLSPCREVFDGTVPVGGSCNLSEECAADAMCLVGEPGGAAACSGTCVARRDAGATCTVDRECAGGPGTWPVCHEGRCVVVQIEPTAAAGQACGRHEIDRIRSCPDGSWCPRVAIGREVPCVALVGLGESCSPGEPPYAECAEGRCVSGRCQGYDVVRAPGEACTGDAVCDGFASLFCNGGTCALATGAPGSDCAVGPWFTEDDCPPPRRAAVGAPCTAHFACESGICGFSLGCLSGLCGGS